MGNLTNERPQAAYRCSQAVLYTIIANGWASYSQYLPVFASKKTTYTAQTATDALAAAEAAEQLPDEHAREATHALKRQELIALGSNCQILWSELSGFIRDAFPESEYDLRRAEAGHAYYEAASDKNWPGIKAMMKSGAEFIAAHNAVLTTPGGMPIAFVDSFTDARTDFNQKHVDFIQSEEQAAALTDQKTDANNGCYRTMTNMFEDAKRYFRFQPSVRAQFTFSRLHSLMTGGSSSAPEYDMELFGLVLSASGEPLHLATVRLSNPDSSVDVQTDENGLFRIPVDELEEPEMATLTVEYEGMIPQSRPVTLVAGEDQEQNFQLEPLGPPPVEG